MAWLGRARRQAPTSSPITGVKPFGQVPHDRAQRLGGAGLVGDPGDGGLGQVVLVVEVSEAGSHGPEQAYDLGGPP